MLGWGSANLLSGWFSLVFCLMLFCASQGASAKCLHCCLQHTGDKRKRAQKNIKNKHYLAVGKPHRPESRDKYWRESLKNGKPTGLLTRVLGEWNNKSKYLTTVLEKKKTNGQFLTRILDEHKTKGKHLKGMLDEQKTHRRHLTRSPDERQT